MSRRDDFSKSTKDVLAKRAGLMCSRPECRQLTVAADSSRNDRAVSVGQAAHITAAAPGGARYDATLSSKDRKSITNGIWLCNNCAKLIDEDKEAFSVMQLVIWKLAAEREQHGLMHGQRRQRSERVQQDIYECAVDLFRQLVELERCVGILRNPFTSAEFLTDEELEQYPQENREIYRTQLGPMSKKLEAVSNTLQKMQPAVDLGVVFWGTEWEALWRQMRQTVNMLFFSWKQYSQFVLREAQGVVTPKEYRRFQRHEFILQELNGETEFSEPFEQIISQVRQFLSLQIESV